MGKRDQDHSLDSRFQSSGEKVSKPARVCLRQKALWARSEQDSRKVHDNVGSADGRRQRPSIAEIRLHGRDIRGLNKIVGQRPPVVHQAERLSAREKVASQQASEVSRRAGDQNRPRAIHVSAVPPDWIVRRSSTDERLTPFFSTRWR
jgi:hypothetical protein